MSKFKFVVEGVSEGVPTMVPITLSEAPEGVYVHVDGEVLLKIDNEGVMYRYVMSYRACEFIQTNPAGRISIEDTSNE